MMFLLAFLVTEQYFKCRFLHNLTTTTVKMAFPDLNVYMKPGVDGAQIQKRLEVQRSKEELSVIDAQCDNSASL